MVTEKRNEYKCKNCKFFDKETGSSGEDNGTCKRLGLNDLLISDARASRFISFHRDSNPQAVFVGHNFGCIHFQIKVLEEHYNDED